MSFSSLLVRGLKKGHWVWNNQTNELKFDSLIKEKKQKKQKETVRFRAINGLTYATLKVDIKFKATVNELELMDFRHYLKERNQGRLDSIVTIQDIKTVATFLCSQQLPGFFHKFFNFPNVNQLLRASIVYIQFYLQTCETLVKTQHFLRDNALPPGKTSTYQALKEDLDDLRVLIGRFYAAVMFQVNNISYFSRTDEILLTEYFVKVSTIVVWIALERKYLSVIKVELDRIFRTGFFNNFSKHDNNNILHKIKPENHVVLNGKIAEIDPKKNKVPNRLNSNSPPICNFLQTDKPDLIMIGPQDPQSLKDDRLKFFTKYILVPETEIQQEGISIGILGLHRRLFDPLLYPCSKRILKLLVTGSPMDIAEDRKRLRENAIKKAMRESEPQSPHIFDELPKIPRPNQFTEKNTVKDNKMEETVEEIHEENMNADESENEIEQEYRFEEEEE